MPRKQLWICEEIRRIRKRKTWVNPTGWEINKGKLFIMTGFFYLLAFIVLLRGGLTGSIVLATIAILFTIINIKTEQQLRNRFKDIEEKFQMQAKEKSSD